MTPSEAELKRAILGVLLPEDEVAKIDVAKLSSDDVRNLVTERLRWAQAPTGAVSESGWPFQAPSNGGTVTSGAAVQEAVVPLGEVQNRLTEGWTWVAPLGSNDAILRRPT